MAKRLYDIVVERTSTYMFNLWTDPNNSVVILSIEGVDEVINSMSSPTAYAIYIDHRYSPVEVIREIEMKLGGSANENHFNDERFSKKN